MNTMEQSLAEALTERVLKLVNEDSTEFADTVMEVEGRFYTDPAQWRAECEMMENLPQIAAPTAMLREPGQYLARTVNNHRRILITRDEAGKAHVFLNACRHRGSVIVEDGAGCQKRFTCPYHNWTYANDGELKGVPFQQGFDGMDRREHGLLELPSEEKYGLVWYALNPELEFSIDDYLGKLAPDLAQWNYADFEYISHNVYSVQANWKNAIEAFAEFYHFKFVHANSLVGQGTISNVTAMDTYGRHTRLLSPLATITELNDNPQPYHGSQHLAVVYNIFPNVILANSPIGAEVLQIMPGNSPDTVSLYYVGMANMRISDNDTLEGYKGLFAGMQEVAEEDLTAMVACTAGINSGLPKIVFGKNEPGNQHFIRAVREASEPYRN